MIEFSFRVRLQYPDAQVFGDVELEKAHDRLAFKILRALIEDSDTRVIVEVEPT